MFLFPLTSSLIWFCQVEALDHQLYVFSNISIGVVYFWLNTDSILSLIIYYWSLVQTGTRWTGVDEKKKKERERVVSLRLHGKPTKLMHRTCTTHEGTGRPLKEVLKAQVREWARQVSTPRKNEDRKKDVRDPYL